MTIKLDPLTAYILEEMKDNSDNESSEDIQEGKTTSRSTVTRQTKIKKATGQLASVEARKRNDPLYSKMVKYRVLYFKYKEMIHRKYSPRVRSKARR